MSERIVNLRALAIMLIVFGHSIIIYDPSWGIMTSANDYPILAELKHLISFIQLKLFFAISGFCLCYSLKYDFPTFTIKKLKRLIIPYIFITILWMDPIKCALQIPGYESISSLKWQLVGLNSGHLWYLVCLFGIMLISYMLIKVQNITTNKTVIYLWG